MSFKVQVLFNTSNEIHLTPLIKNYPLSVVFRQEEINNQRAIIRQRSLNKNVNIYRCNSINNDTVRQFIIKNLKLLSVFGNKFRMAHIFCFDQTPQRKEIHSIFRNVKRYRKLNAEVIMIVPSEYRIPPGVRCYCTDSGQIYHYYHHSRPSSI